MLLLVTLAAAHVPHSVVAGFVVGDPGRPWWALYAGGESSVLYRSDDEGHLWTAVPAAPLEDETRRLGRLEDGSLILLAARRVWWSEDGVAWASAELEGAADALAVSGASVLLRGSSGWWAGPPDQLIFTFGAPVAIGGGAALLVATEDGQLRVDEATTALPVDPAEVVSLHAAASTSGSPEVYLGAADGAVWRYDGAWTACGLAGVDPAHPEIAAIADGPDGTLHAVAAEGRMFTSVDRCATWTRVDTPFHVDFDGNGGAADVAEAVAGLVAVEDHVVVAGWDGLVRGPDWAQERLLPPDYIRGAAVGADGAVYLASLSGVLRSFDGGASWDAPHRGAAESNVQRVAADPARPEELWAIVNHVLHRSFNHGADWEVVETGMGSVSEVWVTDVPWIAGDRDLAWWDGAAWQVVATGQRHAWPDGAAFCVSDVAHTACTSDRGATWVERPEVDLVAAAGPVAMREDALLFDGVEVVTPERDAFRNLTRTAGGTWYATTRGARVYRSDDGSTWNLLPLALPSAPSFLLPVGESLLLATYDGAFLLSGDTVERFGRFQSVAGASGFDDCDGCTLIEDACAWMDHVTRVRGSVSADLRGDHVEVHAFEGEATLYVDGAAQEGTSVDVADGVHEVRLEGAFRFGALVGTGAGAVLPLSAEPPEDDCGEVAAPPAEGCGGGCGGGRALLVVAALPALRRRRVLC